MTLECLSSLFDVRLILCKVDVGIEAVKYK